MKNIERKILNKTTTYIKVNNSLGDLKTIDEFDKVIDEFIQYKNLIIDLTETPSGGNTTVARSIMGRFINKTMPYQQHEFDEKEFDTKRKWVEYVTPRKTQYKGKVFVIVGDVSGKGLAASFYMSKLQTMVRLYCNETNTPYNVLSKINFRIYKEMEKNWFITATVALFDIESKSVKICRAGHTSTVLVNNGNLTEITPSGIGLGLEEGKIFDKNLQEIELQFDEKSLFTFYSDGVTEAMNSKNEMFGVAKLNQLLLSKYELSANLIKDELLEELKHHRKNYPQNDDITFVLVKII